MALTLRFEFPGYDPAQLERREWERQRQAEEWEQYVETLCPRNPRPGMEPTAPTAPRPAPAPPPFVPRACEPPPKGHSFGTVNNTGETPQERHQSTHRNNGVSHAPIPTRPAGINSDWAGTNSRETRDARGRWLPSNPWRFRKGQSGNPRGRPRVDHTLLSWEVIEMRERFRGHSRKDVFGALYVESGNAYRSALLAGYAATTAKSKAYLMAKRVRKELGME